MICFQVGFVEPLLEPAPEVVTPIGLRVSLTKTP